VLTLLCDRFRGTRSRNVLKRDRTTKVRSSYCSSCSRRESSHQLGRRRTIDCLGGRCERRTFGNRIRVVTRVVDDGGTFGFVESASSFDSSVKYRPSGVFVLARFVVLLNNDWSMFTGRIFDEEVVLVRSKVMHVVTRDERISFSSTVELLVAQERGQGRVALEGSVFVRRVRVDASENEV